MDYSLLSKDELVIRLQRTEAELSRSKALLDIYYHIIDRINCGIVVHDLDSTIRFCNRAATHILGLRKEEIRSKRVSELGWNFITTDGETMNIADYPVSIVLEQKRATENVVAGFYRKSKNNTKWLLINAFPILHNHDLIHVMVTFVDITEHRRLLEEIRESESKLSKIITSTPVGICVTNEHGVYEEVNPAYCLIYGYNKEELIGRSVTIVCPEDIRETVILAHDKIISSKSELASEWEVVRKDGKVISIYSHTTSICGTDGRPKNVTFVIDITARKKFEEELKLKNRLLQKQAITDSLTGFLNHGAIFNALEIEIIRALDSRKSLCILMLNIDNLMKINDEYGHIAGDSILMSVSQVLNSVIRKDDLIGRYEGKQFLIIFPNTCLEEAVSFSERMQLKVLKLDIEYDTSVLVNGGLVQLTNESALELVRKAEALLHKAKKAGKSQILCSTEKVFKSIS
ncbi:PAS domain S-box protein [Heliobacterium chlorum]|uniref:PAS domain S-box protein n=1 Tax=Heliobacterium chlorum TaxID=2698 RepID=A0ABR7SZN7_HELCL|nr:PAS domain S-box protein [Heliobacterium chlorum]MBC9782891.1 PAS domain S-box protein [Heliobacterium chlorum]